MGRSGDKDRAARQSTKKPGQSGSWARVLGNRNFATLLAGEGLSTWGGALYAIALVWSIYRATGSVLATAAVGAAMRAGPVLAGPVAGVFVDRWDTRRTMIGSDGVRLVLVLFLALLIARGDASPVLAYPVIFLLACVGMVFGPAFHVLVARIVPSGELATANGVYAAVMQSNALAAQAAGGVVVSAIGAASSLALDALSFLASMAAVALIRLPPDGVTVRVPSTTSARGMRQFWTDLSEGWRIVRHDTRYGPLMLVLFAVTIGGSAYQAVVPVVVFRQLHGGPALLGGLEAAGLAGGIGGGLLTAWVATRLSLGSLLAAEGAGLGAGAVVIGLSRDAGLSALAFALMGSVQAAGGSAFAAYFQAHVPHDVMGRVFGLLGAAEGAAGPAAALVGGFLGGLWGNGVLCALAGVWMAATAAWAIVPRALRGARLGG